MSPHQISAWLQIVLMITVGSSNVTSHRSSPHGRGSLGEASHPVYAEMRSFSASLAIPLRSLFHEPYPAGRHILPLLLLPASLSGASTQAEYCRGGKPCC